MLVPKITNPLAKGVRTLEGWLLTAASITPWVVTLVDPSRLPTKIAAEWSAITAVALGFSRAAPKVAALLNSVIGVTTPAAVDVESVAEKVAAKLHSHIPTTADIKAAVNAAITAIEHPEGIVGGLERVAEGALGTEEELAVTPISPGPVPADGDNSKLAPPLTTPLPTPATPAVQ